MTCILQEHNTCYRPNPVRSVHCAYPTECINTMRLSRHTFYCLQQQLLLLKNCVDLFLLLYNGNVIVNVLFRVLMKWKTPYLNKLPENELGFIHPFDINVWWENIIKLLHIFYMFRLRNTYESECEKNLAEGLLRIR